MRTLNRTPAVKEERLEYEADQRHWQNITNDLVFKEEPRRLVTPGLRLCNETVFNLGFKRLIVQARPPGGICASRCLMGLAN